LFALHGFLGFAFVTGFVLFEFVHNEDCVFVLLFKKVDLVLLAHFFLEKLLLFAVFVGTFDFRAMVKQFSLVLFLQVYHSDLLIFFRLFP
jgi:hypothetical protein